MMNLTEKVMSDKLFSVSHLFFNYLPRRLLVFVIPIGILVAFTVESPTRKFQFIMISGILGVVQISNYIFCWQKHLRLHAEYGDAYIHKLGQQLEKSGLNPLVDRLWTGLEPE